MAEIHRAALLDWDFNLEEDKHSIAEETPLRLVLFTGNYNHIADGVSLTLNRLVGYLERQGIPVLVVGPTVKNPPVKHAGTFIPVPSIPAPGRPEYRIALGLPRKVREQIRAFNATLFHIATPDILGNQALRLAKKWEIPVVASYHTHFSSYLKYYGFEELEGFLWKYLRRFYRQCEQVYVPSHSMAAVLQAHEIKKGLRLWERGVDMQLFNPARRSLEWRRMQGIPDDVPLITFVGRLVLEKGLDIYSYVIQTLEDYGIPHRSMIVGDGPAREMLEAQLPNTLFAGYLSGEDLARAYASSDIFLFPSDTETFGNVTLEAMASGLPVVAADATGSNELVIPGVTGFLAEPRNKREFFKHTLRLVQDAELRVRMGEAGLERASHYDWEVIMERLLRYYQEVLNPHLVDASEELSLQSIPVSLGTAA